MANPNVCVLKTDGINCDYEMQHAFAVAGANPELVHVNELRDGSKRLADYGALAIPGGFSYGDDIASGKVLANELTSYLADQLQTFADDERPILGVCNGFQVLVRTGLLPDKELGEQRVTLAENDQGRFECRWVDLSVGESACRFVNRADFGEREPIAMQVAHGEGKFLGEFLEVAELQADRQVVFSYIAPGGAFPDNPNGSLYNIAGICDPTGVVLGMMPHPERAIEAFHPHRPRTEAARAAALQLFRNIVAYTKEA